MLDFELILQELLRTAKGLSLLWSLHELVHIAGLHVFRGLAVLSIYYLSFLHEAGLERAHFSCPWSVESLYTLLHRWSFLQ